MSAIERAYERWGLANEQPKPEPQPRDPYKWRKRWNAVLRKQRQAACRWCYGTGEYRGRNCPRCGSQGDAA